MGCFQKRRMCVTAKIHASISRAKRRLEALSNETNMLEKIQAMLAEALNLPLEKVTPDAKIVDDLGADSLDVVELLSRLEDEYGVIIPDDEVEALVTVADVAGEIEKLVK